MNIAAAQTRRRSEKSEKCQIAKIARGRETLQVRVEIKRDGIRTVERDIPGVRRAPDCQRRHHGQCPSKRLAHRANRRDAASVAYIDKYGVESPTRHRAKCHYVAERTQLESVNAFENDKRDAGSRDERSRDESRGKGFIAHENTREHGCDNRTERHENRHIAGVRIVDRAILEELVRRVVEEDIPALQKARGITLGELVRRYGDPLSERVFSEGDYRMYLLNTYLEKTQGDAV